MALILVQGQDSVINSQNLMRGSDGTLFIVYYIGDVDKVAVGRSTDGGATWNEVLTSAFTDYNGGLVAAIDSQDTVHMAYSRSDVLSVHHRTYTVAGGFGAESTVRDASSVSEDITGDFSIAIDSSDVVHLAWIERPTGGDENLMYTKEDGAGGWDSATEVEAGPSTGTMNDPFLAIDSNDEIHLVYSKHTGFNPTDQFIYYWNYTDHWIGPVLLNTTSGSTNSRPNNNPKIAIDSSDDLHVVWDGDDTANPNGPFYTKKTSGTWSTPVFLGAGGSPSITVDADDNLHLLYVSSDDIYHIFNDGSWGSATLLFESVSPVNYDIPIISSPIYPKLGGVSTQIATSGYWFGLHETGSNPDLLYVYTSSDLAFPAPSTKNYSRGDESSLPSNDTNLESLFSPSEYGNVLTEDEITASQAAVNQYAVVLFKDKASSSSDQIHVVWRGQSNIAPSISTVYLQIYNRNTSTWETLDSDDSASAGTDFVLTGSKTTGLSNYYDGSNWVSCRVYQLAQ